jgi:formylglycine-generating enzyme required for sulfatase activity
LNSSRECDHFNPVESVSWLDCVEFCFKLQGLFPGTIFRLPTDEEWDHSCRAGTTGATYAESLRCGIGDIAWHSENANNQIQPVKQKVPNPWGLYDMLGNVWEWTCKGAIRGGSWSDAPVSADSYRMFTPHTKGNNLGFRVIVKIDG